MTRTVPPVALALGPLVALGLAIAGCRSNRAVTLDCEPGHQVFVGCGCQMVGSCESDPDPVLRLCDGQYSEAECTWDTQLGENDDGGRECGRCPGLTVICPESGQILAQPRGLYPEDVVVCEPALRDDGPSI